MIMEECWWDGDDFCFIADGKEYRMRNSHPRSLEFKGLDSEADETLEITLEKRYEI